MVANLLKFLPCNAASLVLVGFIKAVKYGEVERTGKLPSLLTGDDMLGRLRDLSDYECTIDNNRTN
jgi:hypothetical protein